LFGLSMAAAIAAPDESSFPEHIAPLVRTRAETVRFRSGDAMLVGTLTVPDDGARHPAIVVLHDASAPTRDYALYRHLTEGLPPLGFAVFVYDRRGSGQSSGDNRHPDFTILADDGIAAARAIAAHPGIDPRHIGYWGLSQGGWLSVLAASRDPKAAFVVSISGPLTTPAEQMSFGVGNLMAAKGLPQSDIDQAVAARKQVVDYYNGKVAREVAQAAIDGVAAKPWFADTYLRKDLDPDPATSRWRAEMDYDPAKPLEALTIPVLVIYGDHDPWVPVAMSLSRLAKIAPLHRNITVAVIPDTDHEMMPTRASDMDTDAAAQHQMAPQAPEYFLVLGAWLERQTISGR
jgi:pimeloyl-ACP methyl ester carboxylesterase